MGANSETFSYTRLISGIAAWGGLNSCSNGATQTWRIARSVGQLGLYKSMLYNDLRERARSMGFASMPFCIVLAEIDLPVPLAAD